MSSCNGLPHLRDATEIQNFNFLLESLLCNSLGQSRTGSKRPASINADENDGEEDRSTNKRIRTDDSKGAQPELDEPKFPWCLNSAIEELLLPEDLVKTNKLLTLFAEDPKKALRSLLNSTKHGAFPESEWLIILKGGCVNLDKVLSSFHNISYESTETKSLGDDIEIRLGKAVEHIRKVTNSAEWTLALDKAEDAILVAFPHREKELRTYKRYISQIFGTTFIASITLFSNFNISSLVLFTKIAG